MHICIQCTYIHKIYLLPKISFLYARNGIKFNILSAFPYIRTYNGNLFASTYTQSQRDICVRMDNKLLYTIRNIPLYYFKDKIYKLCLCNCTNAINTFRNRVFMCNRILRACTFLYHILHQSVCLYKSGLSWKK